jgi:hypothetical protein
VTLNRHEPARWCRHDHAIRFELLAREVESHAEREIGTRLPRDRGNDLGDAQRCLGGSRARDRQCRLPVVGTHAAAREAEAERQVGTQVPVEAALRCRRRLAVLQMVARQHVLRGGVAVEHLEAQGEGRRHEGHAGRVVGRGHGVERQRDRGATHRGVLDAVAPELRAVDGQRAAMEGCGGQCDRERGRPGKSVHQRSFGRLTVVSMGFIMTCMSG